MKTRTIKIAAVFTLIVMVLLVACTPLYEAQAAEPTPTPTAIATATPIATPTPALKLININTATLDELKTLPGIGEKLAQAIIDKRPYKTVDAVLNVRGIGYSKLEKIRSLITIGDVKPEGTPTPTATPTATPKPKD